MESLTNTHPSHVRSVQGSLTRAPKTERVL